MKDFCFIVFSHADTDEKDQILNECLISLKKIGIEIILTSHIPVSKENQEMCDYFIKNNHNLILSESDIFNNPPDVFRDTFCLVDYFGGMRFETSIFKKTYQPAVFNLYIGAFKIAKQLGFRNAIFWEHDYVLGDNSVDFIIENMKIMREGQLESISFSSSIQIFNNDKIEKEIDCCYAVPVFFNIDKFLSSVPDYFLETPKEYTNMSEMMILEQWVKKNVIENCNPRLEYSYSEYTNLLPDVESGKIISQNNYFFIDLKSGIYFDGDRPIIAFNNSSNCHLNSIFSIINMESGEFIFNGNFSLPPGTWRSFLLAEEVYAKFNSSIGCKVIESIEEGGNADVFEYYINRENLSFLSSLKKYSVI